MQLRKYQKEAVDSIWKYFESHSGNPLLVLPTASGKSVIQAAFIKKCIESYPDQKFLLLSHVKELLEQNAKKLIALCEGVDIGIYSAGLGKKELGHAVTIAGIQSIYKKACDIGNISLIIVDECHLIPKKGNGRYLKFFKDIKTINPYIKIIGMTATPYRLDSGYLHIGDNRIFTDIAYDAGIPDLINAGFLCPLISKRCSSRADLSAVKVRGGEYLEKDLAEACDKKELIKEAVDEIMQLCDDRNKWIIFCINIAHANHVKEEIESRGITCGIVTGETTSNKRKEILDNFKSGKIKSITNVNVLTTGFDAPDIDAIIMLRPTLSTGLYVQMLGRGMRIHPSKSDTLVLDFTDNIMRHGPIDMVQVNVSRTSGESSPWKECPKCNSVLKRSIKVCPDCQFEFKTQEVITYNHSNKANGGDILAFNSDNIKEFDVDKVKYRIHISKNGNECLMATYTCGLMYFNKYLCFNAIGKAKGEAIRWWTMHPGQENCSPNDTESAHKNSGYLLQPSRIKVELCYDQYPKILAYYFDNHKQGILF